MDAIFRPETAVEFNMKRIPNAIKVTTIENNRIIPPFNRFNSFSLF
jgi:hypothetical protein